MPDIATFARRNRAKELGYLQDEMLMVRNEASAHPHIGRFN
jgi:hypothetical protein